MLNLGFAYAPLLQVARGFYHPVRLRPMRRVALRGDPPYVYEILTPELAAYWLDLEERHRAAYGWNPYHRGAQRV